MTEKAKKMNKILPIVLFGCFILVFNLLFTRLFIKTDDGNFLGIVNNPLFSYEEWLTERYNTVSGRTVGEFLLSFFLKHNLVAWKILNTAAITYIVCFWYKLSQIFDGEFDYIKRQIVCCCGIFSMLISCLNPSVFWFSGSFSYLLPFAGMLMTVSPLVFYVFDQKVSDFRFLISFFFAFIGTMQEQSAACCTAIYLILLLLVLIKKKKFKISMFIPVISISICDWFLFTAAGAKGRNIMESQASFPIYSDYNIFQKLSCGLAAFFSNSYYLSNFLMLMFIALLSVLIFEKSRDNHKTKIVLIGINIFAFATCVLFNYLIAAIKKGLPHIIFRNSFYKNEFNRDFYVLFILGCILSIVIIGLVCFLMYQEKKLGIIIGLCVSAGFCSALVMSFSPTVFSSGQRVAFYTNMFVITACIVLFSNISRSKLSDFIYKTLIIYSSASFVINCFAFRLAEHPIMG